MIFGLKPKSFWLVVAFTAIETLILAYWLVLALQGELVGSLVVLFLGLLLEHIIATITGRIES